MNIGVAYADKFKQLWLKLEVPDGSTVMQAIEKSGLLEQFPEIDLTRQKVGIFGKIAKLDAVVEEGSRIEVY
ncbi:MAG: RnfH family protein, partial [gamma proteobacterium symbiont of Stewartia floridana]